MTLGDIAAVIIGAAALVAGAFRLRRMWRALDPYGQQPVGWPFGDAGWRAMARLFPANYAAVICLVLAWGLLSIAADNALLVTLGLLAFLATVVLFGLVVRIALFNRPSWLIAPSLRGEPGLVEERRNGKRDSARGSGR